MAAGTRKVTNEKLVEHLQNAAEHTQEAADIIEQLWTQNIVLVRRVVHEMTGLRQSEQAFEDMEQQAFLGFYAAAHSYTPERGIKFSTYATNHIKWELYRYYEQNGQAVRIPQFMRQRIKEVKKKQKELAEESGGRISYESALQALGLPPAAIAGTLAAIQKFETTSLDANIGDKNSDNNGTLLEILASDAEIAEETEGQVWVEDLHRLLIKALGDAPTGGASILSRHYFGGVTYRRMAEESGVTCQAIHERKMRAIKAIRAGRYAEELAEFLPSVRSITKADRLIKETRRNVERLQLAENEKELLAL